MMDTEYEINEWGGHRGWRFAGDSAGIPMDIHPLILQRVGAGTRKHFSQYVSAKDTREKPLTHPLIPTKKFRQRFSKVA